MACIRRTCEFVHLRECGFTVMAGIATALHQKPTKCGRPTLAVHFFCFVRFVTVVGCSAKENPMPHTNQTIAPDSEALVARTAVLALDRHATDAMTLRVQGTKATSHIR